MNLHASTQTPRHLVRQAQSRRLVVQALLAYALTSCGCQTYYRFDGARYYRVDECPGKAPRVVCDSPTKLPSETCK